MTWVIIRINMESDKSSIMLNIKKAKGTANQYVLWIYDGDNIR